MKFSQAVHKITAFSCMMTDAWKHAETIYNITPSAAKHRQMHK